MPILDTPESHKPQFEQDVTLLLLAKDTCLLVDLQRATQADEDNIS